MASTDETTVTPAELGIDPEKLKPLRDRAEREVAEGVLPSAQIAVARLFRNVWCGYQRNSLLRLFINQSIYLGGGMVTHGIGRS